MPAANVDRHAPSWNGDDRTLCGLAYEGSPTDDEPAPEIIGNGETITCDDCRRLIDYCTRFKLYKLA